MSCRQPRRPTKRRGETAITAALFLAQQDGCRCEHMVTALTCRRDGGSFYTHAVIEHEEACDLCRR